MSYFTQLLREQQFISELSKGYSNSDTSPSKITIFSRSRSIYQCWQGQQCLRIIYIHNYSFVCWSSTTNYPSNETAFFMILLTAIERCECECVCYKLNNAWGLRRNWCWQRRKNEKNFSFAFFSLHMATRRCIHSIWRALAPRSRDRGCQSHYMRHLAQCCIEPLNMQRWSTAFSYKNDRLQSRQ